MINYLLSLPAIPRKRSLDGRPPKRYPHLSRRTPPTAFLSRYEFDATGRYRVFNDAEFQLFDSTGDPLATTPTEAVPFAVSPVLPVTPADTYAAKVNKFSAVLFNGVLSSGFRPLGPKAQAYRSVYLLGGVVALDPPDSPGGWDLKTKAGGVVNIAGWYRSVPGELRAEDWALYFTFDGSTPSNPLSDTPDATTPMPTEGVALLDYDLPAQANGTTVKVRVHTQRTDGVGDRFSEDSVVLTIIADDAGPAALL